jgi:topoisomerase-4 subunit A
LGGRDVWFDHDVKRLNYDGRGEYLGEFQAHDLVLVVLDNGEYYTSTFEATNHYEDNIIRLEKFRPKHVWTALLNDADQGYPYIKRFEFEPSVRKQRYLGENEKSTLIILSDKPGAMFEVRFGGNDSVREPLTIDAEEFIAVKSFKAKGKRITNFDVAEIIELEPKQVETPEADAEEQEPTADVLPEVDAAEATDESIEPERSDDEVRDEITGQQRIF